TRFSRDWSSDVCSSDLHAHHCAADDIGGRPLDRRVDGRTLMEAALGHVLRVDQLEMAAAAEDGAHIAVAARFSLGRFHVVTDAEIGRASCRERGSAWGV